MWAEFKLIAILAFISFVFFVIFVIQRGPLPH
jgi:hypothetical protein